MTSTTNVDTSPIPPTPPADADADADAADSARQSRWITAAWCAHWLIRMFVAAYFFIYGWTKVFLLQMGTIDYPESLITVGEKSPMGLLWTWMGYSPTIQIGTGIIEVLVGFLLLWRRTTPLGAMLGVAGGFIVWLLNMTYDVPVKALSGMLAALSAVILIPWIPRVLRFLTGKPFGAAIRPNAVPPEKLRRFTRFFPALAAIGAIALPVAMYSTMLPGNDDASEAGALAGVWRVQSDTAEPGDDLAADERWSQIAFGTRPVGGTSPSSSGTEPHTGIVSVRQVDGTLWFGTFDVDGEPGADAEPSVSITLDAPLGGDNNLGQTAHDAGDAQPQDGEVIEESFTASIRGDGLTLGGEERNLRASRDIEGEYLFDKEFSWSGTPVNR